MKPISSLATHPSLRLLPGLLALSLCACSSTFYKDLNGRIDAGQADRIPAGDLQKLAQGSSAFAQFVFNKWKFSYNRMVFGSNADPAELSQQIYVIESAAKAGYPEAQAFLPVAQDFLRSLNLQKAQKATAPNGPTAYASSGPLEVLTLTVLPATDLNNPYYVYRRVAGLVRNRTNQPVASATLTVHCFDIGGQPLGPSELTFRNVDPGGTLTFSEDVHDGTCSVKPVAMAY